ncbi:hypothetical protein DFH11DRAFT_890765 [Phellopilus nigrolimitatus]|nr:hypothetical protein DFH11DRAFT_890765 [Phellopilus nigrolimitatus]
MPHSGPRLRLQCSVLCSMQILLCRVITSPTSFWTKPAYLDSHQIRELSPLSKLTQSVQIAYRSSLLPVYLPQTRPNPVSQYMFWDTTRSLCALHLAPPVYSSVAR